MDIDETAESSELREYRLTAREWLRANMEPLSRRDDGSFEDLDGIEPSAERVRYARTLQQKVFRAVSPASPSPCLAVARDSLSTMSASSRKSPLAMTCQRGSLRTP